MRLPHTPRTGVTEIMAILVQMPVPIATSVDCLHVIGCGVRTGDLKVMPVLYFMPFVEPMYSNRTQGVSLQEKELCFVPACT
jgi:hypothetical protein